MANPKAYALKDVYLTVANTSIREASEDGFVTVESTSENSVSEDGFGNGVFVIDGRSGHNVTVTLPQTSQYIDLMEEIIVEQQTRKRFAFLRLADSNGGSLVEGIFMLKGRPKSEYKSTLSPREFVFLSVNSREVMGGNAEIAVR